MSHWRRAAHRAKQITRPDCSATGDKFDDLPKTAAVLARLVAFARISKLVLGRLTVSCSFLVLSQSNAERWCVATIIQRINFNLDVYKKTPPYFGQEFSGGLASVGGEAG